MRFLRNGDYTQAIQTDNLEQIIEQNYLLLLNVEKAAQEEMLGYLSQRYDKNLVFEDLSSFSTSSTYIAQNLVEYTEPIYSNTNQYITNDRVSFNSNIYINIGPTGSTYSMGINPASASYWTYLTADKELFYVTNPAPTWEQTIKYQIGDIVFFEGFTYSSNQITTGQIPNGLLNIDNNISIGYSPYTSPNLINTISSVWIPGTQSYSITNIYPTDTNYWTKGDNRNPQIIMYLLDIILYHIHCRINPRNVPELRSIRYDGNSPLQTGGAIGWLKRVSAGSVNVNLPEIIPYQGNSIQWGSSFYKDNNQY